MNLLLSLVNISCFAETNVHYFSAILWQKSLFRQLDLHSKFLSEILYHLNQLACSSLKFVSTFSSFYYLPQLIKVIHFQDNCINVIPHVLAMACSCGLAFQLL